MKDELSSFFVTNAVKIEDVTELAHRVSAAHKADEKSTHRHQNGARVGAGTGGSSSVAEEMISLVHSLPNERAYLPHCKEATLIELQMLAPENAADALLARAQVDGTGRGGERAAMARAASGMTNLAGEGNG